MKTTVTWVSCDFPLCFSGFCADNALEPPSDNAITSATSRLISFSSPNPIAPSPHRLTATIPRHLRIQAHPPGSSPGARAARSLREQQAPGMRERAAFWVSSAGTALQDEDHLGVGGTQGPFRERPIGKPQPINRLR